MQMRSTLVFTISHPFCDRLSTCSLAEAWTLLLSHSPIHAFNCTKHDSTITQNGCRLHRTRAPLAHVCVWLAIRIKENAEISRPSASRLVGVVFVLYNQSSLFNPPNHQHTETDSPLLQLLLVA